MKRAIRLLLTCLIALSPQVAVSTPRPTDLQRSSYQVDTVVTPAGSEQTTTYSANQFASLKSQLLAAFEHFRRDLGGVTFGIDGATGQPSPLEGGIQDAILGMIEKSPQVADEIRAQGGFLTATFEFRPVNQPANANLYLRVVYTEDTGEFTLSRLTDPPDAELREDITGADVDMRGKAGS